MPSSALPPRVSQTVWAYCRRSIATNYTPSTVRMWENAIVSGGYFEAHFHGDKSREERN
jgi:hypothetical protein